MHDDYEYAAGSFHGLDSDDMKAIYNYFITTTAYTPEADRIQREFLDWYRDEIADDFYWYNWVDDDDVAHAKRMRNSFNLADARTPAEKKQVEHVIKTGVVSTPTGRELVEDEKRIPWKTVGIVGAIGTVGLFVVKFLFGRRF